MLLLEDYGGKLIRLTDERRLHILEHPEMTLLFHELELTIRQPMSVIRSRTDRSVRLYYSLLSETPFGSKWLCVVIKYSEEDAFVVTAYLTDKQKSGELLWPLQ